MPLENPAGQPYINDLNEDWPLGTDYPSDGDNHIRLIKDAIKATFPNITGPVTFTQDELNRGSVPSGSVMLFYQSAAPVGWTRTTGIGTNYWIVILPTTSSGGYAGGTDDPLLNNKVPTHEHTVSGTTHINSVGHVHYVSLGGGGHEHTYGGGQAAVVPGGAGAMQVGNGAYLTGGGGGHTHAGSSGGQDANHVHAITLNTGAPHTGVTGNWVPRYLAHIMCTKD